jgi:hypothetical protein
MRPQGQLKSDGALPDSSDKSGERASQSGQRWGDADLRPPAAGRPKREPKTKLVLGAPPPPAGLEPPADEVDAVAGLFASDRIVPAPGINDAPSEAELGRWVATAQSSLFDERVKDPAPGANAVPPPAGRSSEPQRRPSTPKLPAIALDSDDDAPFAGMSEPEAVPSRKPRGPAAPPPPSPLPVQAKRTGSGSRKKGAAAQPKPAEPEEQDAPLAVKPRKRIERGPSKTLLISVGVGALLSLGAATVLIGVVPNPFAPAPGVASSAPARTPKAAPPVKPAAATPAAVAKSALPKPVVAKSVPAPVAAAKSQAPAVVAVAAKGAAPQAAATPIVAAAASTKIAPAPLKPMAVAPPAVLAAPATDDSEADESSGAGSGKLAQARKLLAADNPQGAETLARQVLAGDPQDHHAMDVLARALMDQDRGKEALPLARKMVQKRAKRVPYRLLLGDLLLMVGDAAGARAEWQKALELAPTDREIKRRLGK